MKKIFALLLSVAMIATLFVGVAFADENDYLVVFDGSDLAGANSVLQFSVTKDAVTSIVINFGDTGFVPNGAAKMGDVTQATNIVGNVATITIASTNNPVVKLPVRNPLVAKNIANGTGFTVTFTGGTGTTTSNLAVKYTVTPSVTTPVLGGTSSVSFNVTQGGNAVTDALVYGIYKGTVHVDNKVTAGSTSTGSFTASITFASTGYSEPYIVEVAKAADGTITGTKTITALYNLTVDGVTAVKYLDARTITGKLAKADGTGVAGAPITLVNKTLNDGVAVAGATTAADGSFAMTAVFGDAAKYAIKVGTVEYTTIDAAGLDLTVTASPTSVIKTLGNTAMTFTVKLPGTTTTPSAAAPQIRILKPDGTELQTWTTELTYSMLSTAVTGTYKVEARWEAEASGNTPAVYDRTGSTTFVVNNPAKLNVSYAPTHHTDGVLTVGSNGVAITLKDIANAGYTGSGATAAQIKKVVITVTGPITTPVTIDTSVTAPVGGEAPWSVGLATVTPTFNIEQAGDLVINGTVTFGDNSVETFTKTYTNNGWKVTTEKVLGTVGDVVTLRAVVTTADGTPVNNAIVTWDGTNSFLTVKNATDGTWSNVADVTVDSRTTNINNGVYTKEVKLNLVGAVQLNVTNTDTHARASLATSVAGQNIYTVTPNVSSVIATLATQTVKVAITNAAGAKLTNIQTLAVTGSTGVLAAPLAIGDATMYDGDADGIVDGYQFSVSPLATGTLTITATTDGGNKVGTATVNVVAPNVTITPGKITQNVTEKFNVKVNDMTGTPAVARTVTLKLTAVGAVMNAQTDEASPANITDATVENQNTGNIAAAAEHKLLVTAWDYVEATTAVAPIIKVEVSYNAGANYVKVAELPVAPLNFALNTNDLFVGGVNRVDATITTANGVAYASKAVTLAGSAGSTDANGKVSLFVNPSSTGTATLSVVTSRSNVFTTKTMNIVSDSVKPVLTITSSNVPGSHEYVLTGKFSDNLGVTTIYVNGAPIPFIAALGEFEHAVTLKSGANVFNVFVFDAAGNGAKETFTVTPAAPVVITIGQANAAIGLDVPATTKNGRLMVPFRWFGEQILGATVDYKVVGTTEIVTLVKAGTTVELTLNSLIAKVNGVAKTLDVAPYASGGRTLVPARFLAETFGYTISWDSATNNVTIIK